MNRLPHPDIISFVPEAPLGILEDGVTEWYIYGDNVVYCCTRLSGREINGATLRVVIIYFFACP